MDIPLCAIAPAMQFNIPTRLCCGQKHLGPQCPDGKVMCCMCFERKELSELSTDEESGKKCDVCADCEAKEKAFIAKRDGVA
jgi:hypothetical protein